MIFTLLDMVSFRSEDCTMWNIHYPDRRVRFTTIPCRLFSYLLENTDRIISREEILNNIWQVYGLEPSNNSINQYVSLIRKSLLEIGCEQEIIQTIPRAGFYIASESIKTESLKYDHEEKKHNRKMKLSSETFLPYAIFFVSIIFILQPILTHRDLFHDGFPSSSLYKAGSVNGCPVYTLQRKGYDFSEGKEIISQKIIDFSLPCTKHNFYIYHPSTDFVYEKSGRAFITRCSSSESSLSKFTDCRSYYVYKK